MADTGTSTERLVVPRQVTKREWEKDGKTKQAWTGFFEFEADGKKQTVKADSWSGECAKVIEDNIGKPVLISVKDTGREFQGSKVFEVITIKSADGKAELYSGGQTSRGGQRGGYSQRPDWSYADREERDLERRSIEAQVAEKAAVEYYSVAAQYGKDDTLLTLDGAKAFAKAMADDIRARIKAAATVRSGSATKSGSGATERSRSTSERDGGLSGSVNADQEPQGSPSFASESGNAPAGTVPNPEPDLAAELIAARNAAIEVFKTPRSVEKAFAMGNDGQLVKFNDMTAEQLARLAADPPSGSQPDAETAGMAGGWS